MLLRELSKIRLRGNRPAGFTLAEVMMSIAVAGVIFAGIFAGYLQSAHGAGRSEQALSVLGLAQAGGRSAPVAKEAMRQLSVANLPVSVAD